MTTKRSFALYPEPQHWWSLADYGAVLDVMRELKAKRVLEFGPGSSTLALIEGGATHIDTCEDDPHWAAVHEERMVSRFPAIVTLHRYAWSPRVSVPTIDDAQFDLALIDGPRESAKRLPVLTYALARCAAVLMPMDDSKGLAAKVDGLSKSKTHTVELRVTGPLAGSFVLIRRRPTGKGAPAE